MKGKKERKENVDKKASKMIKWEEKEAEEEWGKNSPSM